MTIMLFAVEIHTVQGSQAAGDHPLDEDAELFACQLFVTSDDFNT